MNIALTDSKQGSRLSEIDLVRAFAMIGVLAVHATSFATTEMLNFPDSYPFYNFANIYMKFGTPVFICLSSFVLFLNYYSRSLSKETLLSFYRKRLVHIIIPYLVFSTIYYTAVAVTRDKSELPANWLSNFALQLSTGTAYSHLYFVFVSIQFYLLFPAALWALTKWPKLVLWCVPAGIAMQWGFHGMDQWTNIPNEGSWAFSYFSFYMLGVYLGIRFHFIKGWLTGSDKKASLVRQTSAAIMWGAWLIIGVWHAVIWYKLRTHAATPPPSMYSLLWNGYTFLSALLFLWSAFRLERKFADSFLLRKLREFGALSFGIYLIHPLLLAAYREFRPVHAGEAALHLWYAGGFLLALFGSWLIVAIAHRYVPFSGLFFGKNELKPRRGVKAIRFR